ncbi:acetyl-CoA acetyltransferase [Natrinema pellirubrum DSM 15624]|uniref:Acetyl-CoA acetyltransferase n=2 Tax=Natrinema TaxID=88723 RepID=L0JQ43_NATP1|nr:MULTISPECIES: thiolase family protein [Natrinema]ELZ12977.1 acetyl-CoA acetyltransferase [Natrinema thermotolerans DSM 11552]AGB32737.1 acetyl-CoA acetyltransferase [Natrinema pellirubrum DSM 15624]ELY75740.1 acetyl-CoA acetyltransferase [Natrinema pellirubrum DSM 15624]QCC58003.1 acetyl-CoA C-acyltransferase [Natrinema thermotolerans]WMT09097.1 thiolase family protein [Natrinema thermotolerans]
MSGNTPVIVSAVRTAQGKEDGALAEVRSEDLSIPLVDEMLAETGVEGDDVDDLMWGCAQQRSEQRTNIARQIALFSELGESVPATTVDRQCASSAQAIISAADSIAAGRHQAVIAGGVESMSRVKMGAADSGEMYPKLDEEYGMRNLQMGMTAEKVAEKYDISREEQDEYGARSQQRAVEATEAGKFDDEIVPIETEDGVHDEDEGLRPGTTPEKLAELPTVFKEDGTVTPGNASQIADGAAGVMLTSREFADENDLEVLAEVGTSYVAGVDPTVMGVGPVPATEGLLERAGRDIDDYGLVEINEAFASQTLYSQRELGIPDDQLNVNGGAIAIGHPLGCSGARLPVTLVHEMNREGVERGIATECVGFGQGAAIEFELP